MENLRVKIVWGSSDRIKGEWHLGLWGWYDRLPGFRHSGLAISGRGVLRWTAALGLAAYLLGATALYYSFRRNPYNRLTLADTLLLPVRWSHVQEVRGQMLIEEGLADLKHQRWVEANMKLRLGLLRAPHDTRARLALGQFYAVANQRANALKLMTEDLAHGYPGRPYLEALFGLANDGEDYELVVATCERFKSEQSDRSWLALQRALALLRLGRAEDVLDSLTNDSAIVGETARETRATALLELKRPADALAAITEWERAGGPNRGVLLRLKIRALRELGRIGDMEAAAAELRALAPTEPRALAYLVVQQGLAGPVDRAEAALEEFFRRFAGTEQNLVIMVKAAADARMRAWVERCAVEARAHGFKGKVLGMSLVQAQLAVGDWPGAAQTVSDLKKQLPRPEPGDVFWFNWMTRLTAVALRPDEAPVAGLLEVLQQRPVSMHVYRQSCDVLLRAGRVAPALEVLKQGELVYPASRTLAALRAECEKAASLVAKPVRVAEAPAQAEKTEVEFFNLLHAMSGSGRWQEAAQSIREVRVAKPKWFAAREPDLLEWQIRAAAKLGDTLELLAATGLLLDGGVARANRVLALARELDEQGNRSDGERLLREVLRRNPDFPPAERLKAEWAPPPAPAK